MKIVSTKEDKRLQKTVQIRRKKKQQLMDANKGTILAFPNARTVPLSLMNSGYLFSTRPSAWRANLPDSRLFTGSGRSHGQPPNCVF